MHTHDTIAAVATPQGPGGVSIIRISGPEAARLARLLFRPSGPGGRRRWPTPWRAEHGDILAPDGAVLDQGLALFFAGPRSFTTQDTLELQVHGSPAVTRAVLDACLAAGARLAEAGEFTYRAFLGGRMDLSQVEGLAQLINAQGETQRRLALAMLSGGLAQRVAPIRQALVELAARLEASIDFGDELSDQPSPDLRPEWRERVCEPLGHLAQASRSVRAHWDPPTVVLYGPANAGKSTLFNRLLARDAALVSAVAGTTRDALEAVVELGGLTVRLVDTAGLEPDARDLDALGQERARQRLAGAGLAVLVLDGSVPPDGAREAALAAEAGPVPLVTVVNKADLPQGGDRPTGTYIIDISAREGQGLEKLRQAVAAVLGGDEAPVQGALANARQLSLVEAALTCAQRGLDHLGATPPAEELASLEAGAALAALDRLLGTEAGPEVIDSIFSQFCVGK